MSALRLFAIFGSMLPLGLLTAWSIRDAVQNPGTETTATTTAGATSITTPAVLQTLDTDVELDLRATKWLADGVARPYDPWPAAPAMSDPRWKPLIDEDRPRLESARELAKDWSAGILETEGVEKGLDETGLESAAERLGRLRDTLETKSGRVAKVALLRDVVEKRLVKIKEVGENGKVMRTNRDVFNRADQAFKSAQYDQCIKILTEWLGPRTTEVDTLEVAARYHKEGELLRLRIGQATKPTGAKQFAEPTPAWAELTRDLEIFFTKYPESPVGAAPTLDQNLRSGQKKLRLLIATQDIPRVPVRNTTQMVATLNRILAQSPEDDIKPNISAKSKEWMERGLGVKDIPEKKYQIAVDTQLNVLLEGEFLKAPGGDSWRFWSLQKPRATHPNAYDPYPDKRITMPRDPPDKAATKDYLLQREILAREMGDLKAWKEFERRCGRYEEEIASYAALGGKVDVSFAAERLFAQDVIKNWEELEPILNR